MNLALNNLQNLICHKIQTNKQTNKQTYLQQLCADTVCSLEDLPETMDYRDE